jgi:hypothetical protein
VAEFRELWLQRGQVEASTEETTLLTPERQGPNTDGTDNTDDTGPQKTQMAQIKQRRR